MKLEKAYDPKKYEEKIYQAWEKSGYFNPDNLPPTHNDSGQAEERKEPFSIVLPPPNVTGTLHTGHAIMLAIEDTMVRFWRMRGKKTLWVPGVDHAAIATQTKVEKNLYKNERKTRHDLGREKFLKIVEKFASESHKKIVGQIKKMGASVDWSREAYTLDKERANAVFEAFKRMYDEGLIYRGNRIVNWDPRLQTNVSDDEVERVEKKTSFYYLKYGPFTIGTARPETKFGDKYVVMHPDDNRYKNYSHGQKIKLEWINGPIEATIIKDEAIDMEFGTGVMTITPWHDATDFEIAERHNLEKEQIISLEGKLLQVAEEFSGMPIEKARKLIIEKLKKKGLVEKIDENYVHSVAVNSRGGGIIEPQIREQWFVDVNKKIPGRGNKSLKEMMRSAVKDGHVKIVPERFEKIYFHWIDNLRDWNISRQIWFGHRVPVWYRSADAHGKQEIKVSKESPGEGWEQDPDTLDTWFSSGLWTFSTLGWPKKTKDLETFHPTDVLETGYDILFFWVARMILMSGYLLGEAPFKTVYLHGLVRDEKGRKMSKSLDNSIDPIDLIEKFGTDALRMAMVVGVGPGSDTNLGDDKLKSYKHFANKIWNASRFVLMNLDGFDHLETSGQAQNLGENLSTLVREVTQHIENYRYHLASEQLYHYFWHTFADKIIEEQKEDLRGDDEKRKKAAQNILYGELSTLLKLLHPFMPFITEVIWEKLPKKEDQLLIVSPWPTF